MMITDEYSGKNDPYKKPAANLMAGEEWYERAMSNVATVFRNRPENDYDLGVAIRHALQHAANLTDKETTDE